MPHPKNPILLEPSHQPNFSPFRKKKSFAPKEHASLKQVSVSLLVADLVSKLYEQSIPSNKTQPIRKELSFGVPVHWHQKKISLCCHCWYFGVFGTQNGSIRPIFVGSVGPEQFHIVQKFKPGNTALIPKSIQHCLLPFFPKQFRLPVYFAFWLGSHI